MKPFSEHFISAENPLHIFPYDDIIYSSISMSLYTIHHFYNWQNYNFFYTKKQEHACFSSFERSEVSQNSNNAIYCDLCYHQEKKQTNKQENKKAPHPQKMTTPLISLKLK